jgi:hypothetical protein
MYPIEGVLSLSSPECVEGEFCELRLDRVLEALHPFPRRKKGIVCILFGYEKPTMDELYRRLEKCQERANRSPASATTPTTSQASSTTPRRGGTQYAKYIEDAEGEGDQELADFFREVQQQDADRAKRARVLLMDRQ